jgi:hypothetical protein
MNSKMKTYREYKNAPLVGHRWLLLLLLVAALVLGGCGKSDDWPVTSAKTEGESCVVCHMNQETLMLLAEEEPEGTEDAGEG